MNEIEQKIQELAQMFETIPNECKGDNNTNNRHEYIILKSSVNGMIETIKQFKKYKTQE